MLSRPEVVLAELEIVERAGVRGATVVAFAKGRWPNRTGARLHSAAGAILAGLLRAGLVQQWGRRGRFARYTLSPVGRRWLRDVEEQIQRGSAGSQEWDGGWAPSSS